MPARPQTLSSRALAAVRALIGNLAELSTPDKASIVGAINDVNAKSGELNDLTGGSYNTLAEAINDAYNRADSAITDLGVVQGILGDQPDLDTSASPTFANVRLTGGLRTATRLVNASGALTVADRFVEVDTTGGVVTLTLPAVATVTGQDMIIKRVAGGSNLVIDPNSAEQLDGSSTSVTISDNNVRRYWSTGFQWRSW